MYFLGDIWRVLIRLVRALVFNPPSLPVWATWFTLIIRTLVVLVLFRRNIAPFVLAKVTRRIRARSISILSIRGLYFRSKGRTWRVERIGWSFHPWAESRVSIKIEGLHVNIAKPKPFIRRERANLHRSRTQKSMAYLATIREAALSSGQLFQWMMTLAPFIWIRTVFYSAFIVAARLFIRCLPSLTQNVDFELDSAIISFETLSGAHFSIRGVTLFTKVDFSHLEKEIEAGKPDDAGGTARSGRVTSRPWDIFSKSGADRFWERVWGQMEGFASLDITIGEMTGYTRPTPLISLSQQKFLPTRSNPYHSFDVHSTTDIQLPSDTFFRVAAPLRFLASSQFSPKHLELRQNSLDCCLEIPIINVSADGVGLLMELKKAEEEVSEEPVRTPLANLEPLSPSVVSFSSPLESPLLISPTSPTSPFMSAFSQIARKRGSISSTAPAVQRLKEVKTQPLIMALKSIKVRLPSISVSYTLFGNMEGPCSVTYVAGLDGLVIDLGLSDPRRELHRKWLGSEDDSTLNASVHNISWRFDLAFLDRLSLDTPQAPFRLITLHKLNIDLIVSQWPQPWIAPSRFLSGDPNASFVACEVSILAVDLTERLEELRTSLHLAMSPKDTPRPRASVPAVLTCIPRVEFRLVCGDIRARLSCPTEGSARTTSRLELHTPGINASLSTIFRTMRTTLVRGSDLVPYNNDIHMDTTSHVLLQPTFARVSTVRDPEEDDEFDPERVPVVEDTLFGLDGVELTITGHTLGQLGDKETIIVQPYTSTMDIRCITNGISIDLWKLECINILRALLDAIPTRTTRITRAARSKSLNSFYAGASVHFAIGCFTGVATGRDINPTCDLELSRGLALRTGVSLQYCCMRASRHSQRVRKRFAHARDRQQLGLPEDLLIQSMAVANAEADSDDISALLQGSIWRTTCRTAISTRFAADDEYDANYDTVLEDNPADVKFISIPRAVIKVRLRRRQLDAPTAEVAFEDICDISADVPQFRTRLDLLNAYSTLLATHMLQSLVQRPRSDAGRISKGSNIRTTLRLRVDDAHILCQFPLHEELFVRVLSISLERRPVGTAKVECRSIVAWVPSAQVEGKWEELSRIRNASVTLSGLSPAPKVAVAADGFRVVLPHRYIPSELILNIGLTLKALRHLRRTVSLGHYMAFESPQAEPPKNVPVINVHIHSVTLEAADSPFEAKLGLIWRTGFQAQKVRVERELAFEAKLRAILASGDPEAHGDPASQSDLHYHFTSKRTTSVGDARSRLNMVHSNSWLGSISRQREDIARKEESILRHLRHATHKEGLHVPIPIVVHTPEKAPPLFRAIINGLSLCVARPTLSEGHQGFLNELGGMPLSTEYSLLLPMHLEMSLNAARMNIRDYHLPLLNIPFNADAPSLEFATDLIIAEEMGSIDSVEWLKCPVVPHNAGIPGAKAFLVLVPKTIMPVKSYASPDINFCTPAVTEFTWGVSYNPAVQEVMRVIETLSHPPRDPSPAIGFWDKLRFVFHWRINAAFKGGAQLHFKGSRDPYHIVGVGAGFDFRWDGNVTIKAGYNNEENELIQLTSDSMIITIPNHKGLQNGAEISGLSGLYSERTSEPPPRKVCAKFGNGIRWGLGISLERTCDTGCKKCHGDNFNRQCRFFNFVPHHQVVLRSVDNSARLDSQDSYAGFRSNFIHFSTSLTSPLKQGQNAKKHNSFHLTPRTFAHFWSWWHLFDSALSLPIRQGSLFPDSRPPSKKFGRHLATIKYRISFSPIYITHVYKIDNGDAWSAGESHCVGVKAFLEHFQADMHQREEETLTTKQGGEEPKIIRHKPFSAVEVVITGLDLRALFAVFAEPQKRTIPVRDSLPGSNKFWESLVPTPLSSSWVDVDDFIELDWSPIDKGPNVYLYEAAHCPRFAYFKRTTRPVSQEDVNEVVRPKTKFGEEDSHVCLMGREPTAHEVQLEFGVTRLAELRARLADSLASNGTERVDHYHLDSNPKTSRRRASNATRETSITQMIALLERYTHHLSQLRSSSEGPGERGYTSSDDLYDMPTGIKLPPELGEFGNVYQVHCPKISLNNTTRNILQQYYVASRARRGFEYHMSARAVKFIRDQAHTTRDSLQEEQIPEKRRHPAGGAQAAAQAVRRMLTGDERQKTESTRGSEQNRCHDLSSTDPLYGWDQGVSERKAHLCLLLKPQIILRSEKTPRSVLVLAADHVVLRNYGILDTVNADDPISGFVMQRNYADIDSLQMFQPVDGSSADHLPLEVFLDFRCESRDFDRLVPQTNATLRYDKFNRLRLRNNVTTVAVSLKDGDVDMFDHLLHETDLIVIQVPRFSVSADASAFASMADVVTDLLLFSDPVHKARMTQLETMLFSYDFTDLASAASVVADLQSRIRQLIRIEGAYALDSADLDAVGQQDMLASKAHVLTLSQELNLIFDAIRLAQDKTDDRNQDKKSALRVQASSSDISWQMLDENRELLAKLAVRGIDYSWLSRQDSSTMSVMLVRDLQAFDGSPTALWPEILAKYDDPPTHHMIRRGLFAEAQWSVLAPVGGISIYDYFEVDLHPIRLALETQLGNKLLDYLIPGRRSRQEVNRSESSILHETYGQKPSPRANLTTVLPDDSAISAPQLTVYPSADIEPAPSGASTHRPLATRRTRPVASRSFSNLRSAAADFPRKEYHAPGIPKSRSSTALVDQRDSIESNDIRRPTHAQSGDLASSKAEGDASEMRQRSAQKTFVHVKIPSIHVLLSVMKGQGFLVRDARLRTHDLEWRNRTWSFEELISQFIPSDPSWRGWVKVAWQQPVFSVGGVVKELITKTQWGRMGKHPDGDSDTSRSSSRRAIAHISKDRPHTPRSSPDPSLARRPALPPQPFDPGLALSNDAASLSNARKRSTSRPRMSNLFRRTSGRKSSVDSIEPFTESPDGQSKRADLEAPK